jgi:hypothetical protein
MMGGDPSPSGTPGESGTMSLAVSDVAEGLKDGSCLRYLLRWLK